MVQDLRQQNAITNGPAARRGTYVGTVHTGGDLLFYNTFGSSATGGGAAAIYVWNAYNRVELKTIVSTPTVSWTLAATATRAAEGSSTFRVTWVSGLQDDAMHARYTVTSSAGAGGSVSCGVGLDTTTGFTGVYTRNNLSGNQLASVGEDCTNALWITFLLSNRKCKCRRYGRFFR